jgi:low molecular weight protein-tyrosine phosphatase
MLAAMTFFDRFRTPPSYDAQVLLVCAGNICRSPMAESVLRDKLARAGLDARIHVESAGTHGDHGMPVDMRAVAAAAKRGYDVSRVRSRRVQDVDFERFDLVLAMDLDNLANLHERCPEAAREKVKLLLDIAPRADTLREVPDPYFGAPNGFEHVLDLLEPACEALVHALQQRLDAEP